MGERTDTYGTLGVSHGCMKACVGPRKKGGPSVGAALFFPFNGPSIRLRERGEEGGLLQEGGLVSIGVSLLYLNYLPHDRYRKKIQTHSFFLKK